MRQPTILGIGTGVPGKRYSQTEILERYLEPHWGHNRRARAIFLNTGVEFRHAAIDGEFFDRERTTRERNDQYMTQAVPLGAATVGRALTDAGLTPQDIDDFFVVSCTGLDIPGLDLRLAGKMGMSPTLRRTCVLGMGCYGAFPALERAREVVLAQPDHIALVLALELCSLHMQFDGTKIETIVASGLFADGASAVVVGAEQPGRLQPRLLDALTFCDYQTFDHMAMHVSDHGFTMQLSAYVPNVLAANVASVIEQLLAPHHLAVSDVRFWAVHPGSGKILDNVQEKLGLDPHQLDFSRAILCNYGNMSSPTIFFVLDEIAHHGNPQPGDYGVLMAFGPGLTLETSLVQWG